MRTIGSWLMLVGLVAIPLVVLGQDAGAPPAEDGGFWDLVNLQPAVVDGEFNVATFLLLILGSLASGSLLAYHPLYLGRVASLDEMDYPKIIITYSVVGTLVGVVVEAVPAMGLAIFGIGALMRFRTELASAKETGRVILATIIGICWGLAFWEGAALATAIAWLLILILDWRVGYQMVIRGLDAAQLVDSVGAYERVLGTYNCRVTRIKRNLKKGQFSVVFRAGRRLDRDDLEHAFEKDVEEGLQGTVDWPREG